jgi:hypothetical protein
LMVLEVTGCTKALSLSMQQILPVVGSKNLSFGFISLCVSWISRFLGRREER